MELRQTISPAGDPAWLVTGYSEVRALLADPRLGRSHPDPDNAPKFGGSAIFGRPDQAAPNEQAEHARMRKLLTPWFSARRLAGLRPRVTQIVDELLTELAAGARPADFHEAVSFPLPALVICELLGVPYADRDDFRRWSDLAGDMSDRARSVEGFAALWTYINGLVTRKLDEPGDDVLSGLVAEHRKDPEGLPLDGVARLGAGLLFAGHETTVAAIDSGVLHMCEHPEQRAALRADPTLIEPAVEEILRSGARVDPGDRGLPRWTTVDIELGGVTIPAGSLVMLGLQQANADLVGEEGAFDVARHPNPHVTFGHGVRFCVGAPLARMELQILFGTLFDRFPTLELAVPAEQLTQRPDMLTAGFVELPVTW